MGNGKNIYDLCELEFTRLREELCRITDKRAATIVEGMVQSLDRMIEIGLPYLSMNRESSTLSGGERQRLKLAKYMDASGSIFVLDEPTTGLHASDIRSIMQLFERFVERGNTVLIIEHNQDVMKSADYIIDIGPDGGSSGGEVVFQGTVQDMVEHSDTITARYIRKSIK